MTVRTTLRSVAESAGPARRFVADVLAQHGFPLPRIEDAMLLVSEAVSYAVMLGGTMLTLSVVPDRSMGRIELAIDTGPASGDGPVPGLSGDSLTLVQALAEAWGIEATPTGRCVWFEVRV